MKKIISVILTLALVLSCVPVNVFAAEPTASGNYIEIVSDSAILRTGPGKSYPEVESVDLQPGDCLALTDKAFAINMYGNIWFEVMYAGEVFYLYEAHAAWHQHFYNNIGDGFNVCKCGSYTIDEDSSMVKTGYALPADTLLSPETVAAVAQLAAAGKAISTVAATVTTTYVMPVLLVTVVAGTVIYMAVSSSGTQVTDVQYIRSKDDVKRLLENDYNSATPYYKCCTLNGNATLLMDRNGMDLNTAANYLKSAVNNPAYATFTALTEKPLISVWCYQDWDALALAERFEKFGNRYGYGTSTDFDCNVENNARKAAGNIYFSHYHLWYTPSFASYMKKVDDAHIFFGNPTFASIA